MHACGYGYQKSHVLRPTRREQATLCYNGMEHEALSLPEIHKPAKLVHKLIHNADVVHELPCGSDTLLLGSQHDDGGPSIPLTVLYGTMGTTHRIGYSLSPSRYGNSPLPVR